MEARYSPIDSDSIISCDEESSRGIYTYQVNDSSDCFTDDKLSEDYEEDTELYEYEYEEYEYAEDGEQSLNYEADDELMLNVDYFERTYKDDDRPTLKDPFSDDEDDTSYVPSNEATGNLLPKEITDLNSLPYQKLTLTEYMLLNDKYENNRRIIIEKLRPYYERQGIFSTDPRDDGLIIAACYIEIYAPEFLKPNQVSSHNKEQQELASLEKVINEAVKDGIQSNNKNILMGNETEQFNVRENRASQSSVEQLTVSEVNAQQNKIDKVKIQATKAHQIDSQPHKVPHANVHLSKLPQTIAQTNKTPQKTDQQTNAKETKSQQNKTLPIKPSQNSIALGKAPINTSQQNAITRSRSQVSKNSQNSTTFKTAPINEPPQNPPPITKLSQNATSSKSTPTNKLSQNPATSSKPNESQVARIKCYPKRPKINDGPEWHDPEQDTPSLWKIQQFLARSKPSAVPAPSKTTERRQVPQFRNMKNKSTGQQSGTQKNREIQEKAAYIGAKQKTTFIGLKQKTTLIGPKPKTTNSDLQHKPRPNKNERDKSVGDYDPSDSDCGSEDSYTLRLFSYRHKVYNTKNDDTKSKEYEPLDKDSQSRTFVRDMLFGDGKSYNPGLSDFIRNELFPKKAYTTTGDTLVDHLKNQGQEYVPDDEVDLEKEFEPIFFNQYDNYSFHHPNQKFVLPSVSAYGIEFPDDVSDGTIAEMTDSEQESVDGRKARKMFNGFRIKAKSEVNKDGASVCECCGNDLEYNVGFTIVCRACASYWYRIKSKNLLCTLTCRLGDESCGMDLITLKLCHLCRFAKIQSIKFKYFPEQRTFDGTGGSQLFFDLPLGKEDTHMAVLEESTDYIELIKRFIILKGSIKNVIDDPEMMEALKDCPERYSYFEDNESILHSTIIITSSTAYQIIEQGKLKFETLFQEIAQPTFINPKVMNFLEGVSLMNHENMSDQVS
uniref:Nuclear receptor domain-containing protein n=1 Tax=Rhabditophanes sp. KR3021 TaxID=114890 RepID=A0AC35UDY2_9BILA